VRHTFIDAGRSFFQARHALFLDERCTFSEARHPFVFNGKHVGT
jgi:hypothetical protein